MSPFSPVSGACLESLQPDSYVIFRLHRCFILWRTAPAKELPECMLITRGFGQHMIPRIKAGNRYLRYYLGEAANSMRKHNVEYGAYYRKKYNEVPKHQHKRALALTSRKFVRLVYGLLARNQLYSGVSLDTSIKDSN